MGGCTSDFKKDHSDLFKKYIVDYESLNQFKRSMKTKFYEFYQQLKRVKPLATKWRRDRI